MVDPWKDCQRIHGTHFADRMHERCLPEDHIDEALKHGRKTMEQKNEYKVSWNGWVVKVSLGRCFVFLRTVYRE